MKKPRTMLDKLKQEQDDAVREYKEAAAAHAEAVANLPETAVLKEAQRKRDAAYVRCLRYIEYGVKFGRNRR